MLPRPLLAVTFCCSVLAGCGDSTTVVDTGIAAPDAAPSDGGPLDSGSDSAIPPTPDAGSVTCDAPAAHAGEATYYDFADGSGNCSFPATPDDLMVAAMNHTDYADSAACGTCAAITGPSGSVTVRIVDRCPECAPGDIDLSPDAFSRIAELSAGRVGITWTYVPCDVAGPVVYHFKDGSSQWWTAVQVRNHRHAVTRFEYLAADGTYVDVPREDYNFFVETAGMGEGPFTFRTTDIYGSVIIDTAIPLLDDGDAPGTSQFPLCE